MTICAAGLNRPGPDRPWSIITVCDRKLSVGHTSVEGMAWKIKTIHPMWRVMFAGEVSPLVALVDAVTDAAANAKENRLRSFARLCSSAYQAERKNIIETEILANYDISSYSEYLTLKSSDRPLFDALKQEIEKAERNWHLLFLGFDSVGIPHLFVITEYGKIQYCDIEGFAAIGSGAYTAFMALSAFKFNQWMTRGEAVYAMLAAKFAAETADGVGEETLLFIFKAGDVRRTIPGLVPSAIKELRGEWEKLPRIPNGAAESIERDLVAAERITQPVADPLKGRRLKKKNAK